MRAAIPLRLQNITFSWLWGGLLTHTTKRQSGQGSQVSGEHIQKPPSVEGRIVYKALPRRAALPVKMTHCGSHLDGAPCQRYPHLMQNILGVRDNQGFAHFFRFRKDKRLASLKWIFPWFGSPLNRLQIFCPISKCWEYLSISVDCKKKKFLRRCQSFYLMNE